MPFTTDICIRVPICDGDPWVTTEPLNFYSRDRGKNYVIAKNYETDLASVPRIPIAFLIAGGTAAAPAIVHDWLYANGMKFKQIESRMEADQIFLEAMEDTNVLKWRRFLMYQAVRWWGESRFHAA